MNREVVGRCWQCGADLERRDLGRETNCLRCGRPTRVCRNCRWFDVVSPDQCRETAAEPVMEKDRPNFCEFFEPVLCREDEPNTASQDALRKAAEDLFKS